MIKRFVVWLAASTLAVLAASHFVPGVHVSGWKPAIMAALVIGVVNGTVGAVVKLLTTPLRWLTLGLATLAINALMVMLSARFVDGFSVDGFVPALIAAVMMGVAVMVGRLIASED
jgi:putative membrane protein